MSHLEDEDPINVQRQRLALSEAEKVLDVRYGSIKKGMCSEVCPGSTECDQER